MRIGALRVRIPHHAIQLGWTILFLILVLVVLNAAGWLYYRSFRASWERELSRSLTAVAVTAASRITDDELDNLAGNREFGYAYSTLRHQLQGTRQTTGWLKNAFISDRDRRTLLDLASDPPLPAAEPALTFAPEAASQALAGRPSASPIYREGGIYYKTAFAPVKVDQGPPRAVLAVEADASFFTGLEHLRRDLSIVAFLSTLAALLLGVFYARATRDLMGAEERARRNETLASMGQLAATMAHEIRNPLAIVRATAERLRTAPPDDEIWQYIPDEVERLNGILTTYLDFARSDPGRQGPLDLVESLERVRLLCEPHLAKEGIRIESDYAGAAPAIIHGSTAGIRQVFLNLILNAEEAMPRGGRLRLSLRRRERGFVCEIADTGEGIPRERLGRIFDVFYSSKEGGSGLGLAVVNRIVREHRGRIEVQSEPGRGTLFRLTFPSSAKGRREPSS